MHTYIHAHLYIHTYTHVYIIIVFAYCVLQHKYIRVGGGYRHGYWYVKCLLEELELQRRKEELRLQRLEVIKEKSKYIQLHAPHSDVIQLHSDVHTATRATQ